MLKTVIKAVVFLSEPICSKINRILFLIGLHHPTKFRHLSKEFRDERAKVYEELLKRISKAEHKNEPVDKVIRERLQKKEEIVAGLRKIGNLENEKDNIDKEYKRMAVLYFFRIRLDYLQWTLAEDMDVKKEMKSQQIDVPQIPADIPEDGKQSFTDRYKVWLAIFKVLCRKSGQGSKEERDYLRRFKNTLTSVGLHPNLEVEEDNAAVVAHLIVNLSPYSKQELSKVDWKNEEEVMCALSECGDIEGDQQKVVRAVYRLKIM